ncbi:MAG TPA: outer membrane lipoprotein carrier protein LolA [Gemmatimonadaceae bacterium]|nr:outer membrane lipoprotein carrier protein LolA [Gemmatimonadaceae bacterium]
MTGLMTRRGGWRGGPAPFIWRTVAALLAGILCTMTVGAQITDGGLLDRAARKYRSAETLRATFRQTLTSPGTKTSHTASGEFLQRGPAHVAFHFSEPAGDAIVIDGDVIWMYLPSTAKGQVLKMPREAGAGLDFLSQLLGAPRDHYIVAQMPDERAGAHAAAVFALTPKGPNGPFTRATLWLGREDAILWQLETVEQSGLVRRLQFTSVRFNAALPKGALTFVAPDGVRVIDQAALLGGRP